MNGKVSQAAFSATVQACSNSNCTCRYFGSAGDDDK